MNLMSPEYACQLWTVLNDPRLAIFALLFLLGPCVKAIPYFSRPLAPAIPPDKAPTREWMIPFILLLVGVLLGVLLFRTTVAAVVGGVIGLAVVGVHQLPKQWFNRAAPIILAILIPLALMGCASAPKPADEDSQPADKFYAAMEQTADKARAFLKSDLAKRNAVPFFRVTTSLALMGYSSAGGNTDALCDNILTPLGSVLAAFTSAELTKSHVERVSAEVGAKGDLSIYDPLADVINPAIEWVIAVLPDDPALALYYIHAAAQGMTDVASKHRIQ